MPFLGVLAVAVDQDALDAPLESYIGPLKVTVNGSFSKAEAKARRATTWDLLKMLAGYAPRFFGWWWRGDQKHSVFFEGKTPIRPVEHTLPQANSGKMLS
jgi:CubicO group peptidase (beta-lactamase class C family)